MNTQQLAALDSGQKAALSSEPKRCAYMNTMNNFKSFVHKLNDALKSKDFSFWSTISTLLLVVITLFLAIATNKMANVMMLDFKSRNMPSFWTTTPKLETNETQTKVSFSVRNASDGVGKRTIHNVILVNKSDQVYAAENIIVKSGKWAKRLNQIPFEYVARAQEDIKLDWPKVTHPPENLKAIIIILTFDTLFDDERQEYKEGYVYEPDHNNFDPMTDDLLDELVSRAYAKKLIK